MTDYELNAATLQRKVDDLAAQAATKINALCRRYIVPQDAADALTADVTDMLHAHYKGLHATTEQMREVVGKITQRTWDRTDNIPLLFIVKYYGEIVQHLSGTPIMGELFLHSVVYCEIARRLNTTPTELLQSLGAAPRADMEDEAQRLYYSYAVLTIGERTDATRDELKAIQPYCDIPEEKRLQIIAQALDFQAQRRRMEAAAAARREKREDELLTDAAHSPARTDRTPKLFDGEKTIAIHQSIANMLSGGVQTADKDGDSGRPTPLRPLRIGIKEQRRAAEAVLNSPTATEDKKKQATQFLATITGVWQALDGMQVITQTTQPDESGGTYSRYDITPYQLARICTGQDEPNKEQQLNCMRAFAWLSTQRMQVWETTEKRITEKDADGKVLRDENGKPIRKVVQRDICTNFQPLIIEFRAEYEDKVLIEDATRVRLYVHDVIRNGRSAEYYIDKSGGRAERLFIRQPVAHVLPLSQFYEAQSDEEKVFRNIVLSKAHLREDKLLAAVFDYAGRQADYDTRAAEAQRIADTLSNSPAATEEQKRAAQKAAQQAREAAKYNITNHMGRDVERLKTMFQKALQCGLLTWYNRDDAMTTKGNGKYGSGFVWTWRRPTADEVAEKKPKRGGRGNQ